MGSSENSYQQTGHLVSAAGVLMIAIFAIIFGISAPFEYGSDLPRPILAVTSLFMLGACVAFWGLGAAVRCKQTVQLLILIVVVGVSLRLLGLFTCPILEIDYYRYLWDGKVAASGVSPYQFSPAQVIRNGAEPVFDFESTFDLKSPAKDLLKDGDFQTVSAISVETQSNNTILKRIHFDEYSTIYPPVSQTVFCLAMKWFPATASVGAHIIFMKSVLVIFDLMILALVLGLLHQLKIHIGWLILYAWNPLVIKEIANGGHLDSIAVFFMMLSIFCIAKWLQQQQRRWDWCLLALGGVALGLGFGAKLFPIVLFPAILVTIARCQWAAALKFGACFLIAGGLAISPMYYWISQNDVAGRPENSLKDTATTETAQKSSASPRRSLGTEGLDSAITAKAAEHKAEAPVKKDGLTSFLSKWRMNDVIFSGIYLNLKPTENGQAGPWYVVTSNSFRNWLYENCRRISFGEANPAFALTRVLTLGAFAIFYLWHLLAIYLRPREGTLSESETKNVPLNSVQGSIELDRLVWILAAFLFVQPTVNPWYWIWVAPLAVFSRNRGWLFVAGLLLLYYSRFWFNTIPKSFQIAGYTGVGLFDHGLAFVELAAILAVILVFKAHKKAVDPDRSTAQYL